MPVYIHDWARCPRKRALIRVPLPYKLAESRCPGNVEEKLRCEAATFIWIKHHCPEIPMPHLWGFGFPGGQTFTALEASPYHSQLLWHLSRIVRASSGHPIPCRYIIHKRADILKIGYLIMGYVEDSDEKLLSRSWTDLPQDKERRANFFADLSRIMLSLARCCLPRIGSMTIDEQGVLLLENRPLTFRLQPLENKGIPIPISRNTTYSSVETYLLDLLSCHDNRIRYQADSVRNRPDGEMQLSVLATMRAVLPHFASRDLRHGPFVFTLTDIHPNNVFVDDDWRITSVIDLEWACVRPTEMILPPVWLTGHRVDQLPKGNDLDAYSLLLEEFFDSFIQEEISFSQKHGESLLNARALRRAWDMGGFWYFHALENPKVMCNLFFQHIQPKFWKCSETFSLSTFRTNLAAFWGKDAYRIIDAKLKDKEAYEKQLQE